MQRQPFRCATRFRPPADRGWNVTPDSTTSSGKESRPRLFGKGEDDARHDLASVVGVEPGFDLVGRVIPVAAIGGDDDEQRRHRPVNPDAVGIIHGRSSRNGLRRNCSALSLSYLRHRALRIAASHAGVAAFEAHQAGRAAARAAPHGAPPSAATSAATARSASVSASTGCGQEADGDHMLLDHLADGGEQRGHVAPAHPWPPRGSNTAFSSSTTKETSPPRAEHGADHAGEADGPGVMLHVLRVDEDLERPAAAVLHRCR